MDRARAQPKAERARMDGTRPVFSGAANGGGDATTSPPYREPLISKRPSNNNRDGDRKLNFLRGWSRSGCCW